MSTVRAILEQKRLPLLDVSSRGAFLNYTPDPSWGLELINIQPLHAYQRLVLGGLRFTFLPTSYQNDSSDTERGSRDLSSQQYQFQTPYENAQLRKQLVQMFHRSSSTVGELSEPNLCLTLGTLRWRDRIHPELSPQAPLVLIPVSLHRQDVRSPIFLQATGQDPFVNQALKSYLLRAYDIELPVLEAFQRSGMKKFLEEVSVLMEGLDGWHLGRQTAHIDFFDLSSLAIHGDLDPDNGYVGMAEEVDLLQKVLTDGFELDEIRPSNSVSIDGLVEPNKLDHVLDANNDQLLVVWDSMRGVNQVIDGAAGTGKTQTIVNIVAAALGQEKSVLVVSNKARALEDVVDRLESSGLEPLILPLFGKGLERRRLLKEIQAVLTPLETEELDEAAHVESLKRLRDQLNQYCKALHTPIRESGVTPYEAYNALVEIDVLFGDISRPDFDGNVLANWAAPRFEAALQRTRELETHLSRIGIPQRHPFWGSKKTIFKAADRAEIQRKCRLAGQALNALRVSVTELAHQMGAPAPNQSEDVIRLVRAASKAIESPMYEGSTYMKVNGIRRWRSSSSSSRRVAN